MGRGLGGREGGRGQRADGRDGSQAQGEGRREATVAPADRVRGQQGQRLPVATVRWLVYSLCL